MNAMPLGLTQILASRSVSDRNCVCGAELILSIYFLHCAEMQSYDWNPNALVRQSGKCTHLESHGLCSWERRFNYFYHVENGKHWWCELNDEGRQGQSLPHGFWVGSTGFYLRFQSSI